MWERRRKRRSADRRMVKRQVSPGSRLRLGLRRGSVRFERMLVPLCAELGVLLGAVVDKTGADLATIALNGANDMRSSEIVGAREATKDG